MRVGSKDQIVNIIGFIIPTNLKPIECLKIRDITDMRSLVKSKTETENVINGYDLIAKYLQQSKVNTLSHHSNVFMVI